MTIPQTNNATLKSLWIQDIKLLTCVASGYVVKKKCFQDVGLGMCHQTVGFLLTDRISNLTTLEDWILLLNLSQNVPFDLVMVVLNI